MSKKIDLLPCPFCGGNLPLPFECLGDAWVRCECGAHGPMAKSIEEAEVAWNRRIAGTSPALPGTFQPFNLSTVQP